ncbi:MAG: 2'-5' RNA ligase [Reyranella sp.]|uniref:2'-5' RNA ligase family protein n=1 Tax=Reyranella sp. TaxID=1929291 RepID=UPI001214B601|nr:2'-5' RNA ligase family protein [Reyranella sp.]TAJ96418.1 MAG: 2'-5' RNA ligase [Reyranella sp.]TBR28676.1 MAG: 2'-5' RNA ligase [Reyranella sp.]
MSALFGATIETFGGHPPLAPRQEQGLSRLGTDRLRRRHAGMHRAGPRFTDRLFFAVLPDAETAERISERAATWRARHGLTGRLLKTGHFHVTLATVHEGHGLPDADEIDGWVARAGEIPMPSFRVGFDRLMSFANGALVLTGDDSTVGMEVLQQRLSDSLDDTPRPARRYTPHVTLLHDGRHIDAEPVEPIAWTVGEIVLVHSLIGQTTHRHVARIPLG